MLPVHLLRENKRTFFLMLWMAIMPLLFSTVITVMALQYEDYIRQFTSSQWLLFYTGASLSMALALIPTTFIALISGYLLGGPAIPYMLTAYLLASGIGYYLAKLADKGKFLHAIEQMPKVGQFMRAINQKQLSFIVLCRISPILPFAIMNVVLSVMKVGFIHFLWAGFLGMLPRTLLFIWIGSTASILREAVEGGKSNMSKITFLVLLLLSIIGFYFYFKQIISKKIENPQSKVE